MRSAFMTLLALSVLALAVTSCGERNTAATPGNPSGNPGGSQPPVMRGPGLLSTQVLQGTWSTGCVADAASRPAIYTVSFSGSSMRYTKERFSSWDCMGPGQPAIDQTLAFRLERVSDDPNDYHVMIYDNDPTFFDWVRYYNAAVPALEFIASDYTSTGGYAHRYYRR
jgi:hypothetical protein